uniref:3Beta_HSD domain-containing protein n=1 Tax=Steinernema glaseri TaxID=37863 RepID=A0A1I8AQ07_9BILA
MWRDNLMSAVVQGVYSHSQIGKAALSNCFPFIVEYFVFLLSSQGYNGVTILSTGVLSTNIVLQDAFRFPEATEIDRTLGGRERKTCMEAVRRKCFEEVARRKPEGHPASHSTSGRRPPEKPSPSSPLAQPRRFQEARWPLLTFRASGVENRKCISECLLWLRVTCSARSCAEGSHVASVTSKDRGEAITLQVEAQ